MKRSLALVLLAGLAALPSTATAQDPFAPSGAGEPDAPDRDESTPDYLKALELQRKGRWKEAQKAFAEVLKKYPNWVVTIEGHCDERGTAEYNLALGERRAVAVRAYLVSLGIPAERLKVISYGKEFPFDPAQTEEAYAKNRRGHFVITSK